MLCTSMGASNVIIYLMIKPSGEYTMSDKNKPDTEQLGVTSIKSRWESCESLDEARKLTEYMISHPSLDWIPIMDEAQKGNVKFGRALLDRDSDFYQSVADLIADQD